MTTHDEDWPRELSLDDARGPASYLDEARSEALVQDVLARFAAPAVKRRSWTMVAAAVLLLCLGGGSASAAVLWYMRAQRSEPAARPVPIKTVVKPRAVTVAPPVEPVITPLPETTPDIVGTPRRAAEDWFREGNELRARRRWKQADEAYGEAARRATRAEVAYVAFVASAGVRLEHLHDARGALARYRSALQRVPHGALDEEIRFGIADAYRALGDARREHEALEELLRAHPQSPLADQARERL